MGLEVNPYITYFEFEREFEFRSGFDNRQSVDFTSGYRYGLSNNFAEISVIYRIK